MTYNLILRLKLILALKSLKVYKIDVVDDAKELSSGDNKVESLISLQHNTTICCLRK